MLGIYQIQQTQLAKCNERIEKRVQENLISIFDRESSYSGYGYNVWTTCSLTFGRWTFGQHGRLD